MIRGNGHSALESFNTSERQKQEDANSRRAAFRRQADLERGGPSLEIEVTAEDMADRLWDVFKRNNLQFPSILQLDHRYAYFFGHRNDGMSTVTDVTLGLYLNEAKQWFSKAVVTTMATQGSRRPHTSSYSEGDQFEEINNIIDERYTEK